jgi:hypothetical protein
MGGQIALGIRPTDGAFRTASVWTSALKGQILDDRFMEDGSLDRVERWIDEWGHESTEGNVPGPYGFVLIDAVEKVVVNWNGYDSIGFFEINPSNFGLTSGPDRLRMRWRNGEHFRRPREIVQKYAVAAERYDNRTDKYSPLPFSPVGDLDKLIDWIDMQHRRMPGRNGNQVIVYGEQLRFTLASPHWNFVELSHDRRSLPALKAHVDRCVKLSAAEEAIWKAEADGTRDEDSEDQV